MGLLVWYRMLPNGPLADDVIVNGQLQGQKATERPMLEAGGRQFQEWSNCDQGRHILIGVARYLAAHFPTRRALLQTADIASRLMRGGELIAKPRQQVKPSTRIARGTSSGGEPALFVPVTAIGRHRRKNKA